MSQEVRKNPEKTLKKPSPTCHDALVASGLMYKRKIDVILAVGREKEHRTPRLIAKSMSFLPWEEKKGIGIPVLSQNRCHSCRGKRKRASESPSNRKIDVILAVGREKEHRLPRKIPKSMSTRTVRKVKVHRNQKRIIISIQILHNTYPHFYSIKRKT